MITELQENWNCTTRVIIFWLC